MLAVCMLLVVPVTSVVGGGVDGLSPGTDTDHV